MVPDWIFCAPEGLAVSLSKHSIKEINIWSSPYYSTNFKEQIIPDMIIQLLLLSITSLLKLSVKVELLQL